MLLTRGERAFGIANTLFLFAVTVVILVPLGFVIKKSLDIGPPGELNLSLVPREFSFFYYRYVLSDFSVYRPFLNSIYITAVGTVVSLALNSMGAYTLARKDLPGGRFLTILIIVTMVFSGGLLPLYIVVLRLGLMNRLPTLILLGAVDGWYMILIKNFYRTVPDSLLESARMDGAGEFLVYRRVVLPLARPAIAAIGLFTAVGFWNTFYNAVIFMNDPVKYTFPVKLREIISYQQMQLQQFEQAMTGMGIDIHQKNATPEGLGSAIIIISMVPIIVIYPFLQRHFSQGILVGSLKG